MKIRGKLNRNTISYHLFGEPLGLISDIKSTLQNAISDEDNIRIDKYFKRFDQNK